MENILVMYWSKKKIGIDLKNKSLLKKSNNIKLKNNNKSSFLKHKEKCIKKGYFQILRKVN